MAKSTACLARRNRNSMRYLLALLTGTLLSCGATLAQDAAPAAGNIPRMADGHPDLSGVWWRGGDIGGRGGQALRGPRIPPFSSLYLPSAEAKAKTLADKDDPS